MSVIYPQKAMGVAAITAAAALGIGIAGFTFKGRVDALDKEVSLLDGEVDLLHQANIRHELTEAELLRKADYLIQTLVVVARDAGVRVSPTPPPAGSAAPSPMGTP